MGGRLWRQWLPLLAGIVLAEGCAASDDGPLDLAPLPEAGEALFTVLPPEATGIASENRLEDDEAFNVFTYRNFYNGGGVAVGDLTGDGLPEVVLTSNHRGPTLYLNEGGLRFRDITRSAGLDADDGWTTGVALADVNGDGLLDVYLARAGEGSDRDRENLLFIHRGVDDDGRPSFRESAGRFGLDDPGYSTHAAFFDYDRDGDLDAYVVNNSSTPVSSFGPENLRDVRDRLGGDRLYRNDDGAFVDVSEAAGIHGNEAAFGLGVAVTDFDGDGWLDLYVSNDFFEQDYLYLNRRDGTFVESLAERMPYTSLSSMGLDAADVDNDGSPDLYVTDMLPADEFRFKTTATFEDWEAYRNRVATGFHHQFTRNMLHLNDGGGVFAEIGFAAGVARTDWSWSALLADFDLDGLKDLHVTNGLARDVTSQDYLDFLADEATMRAARTEEGIDYMTLIRAMGSTPLPNYAFRNLDGTSFVDVSAAWGLATEGFSAGAAYGDLDGDGDLDLVVSNVDAPASVYRNESRGRTGNHYLQVELRGEAPNTFGVGARVRVWRGETQSMLEQSPSRGFQSSVDYLLTFGLGGTDTVDSLRVEWPDGQVYRMADVGADQRIVLRQAEATSPAASLSGTAPALLTEVRGDGAIGWTHRENPFSDFERQPLIPRMNSTAGPATAVGDVNGDGLDDLFLGGAKDQPGALFLQTPDGRFVDSTLEAFARDAVAEDVSAAFFDADRDGDLDLYVVSGGSELSRMASAAQDRLYLNDGAGAFTRAGDALPSMDVSGSRVVPGDFDRDGDLDLFVGARLIPWAYGATPRSALLANDGRGRFTDVTDRVAPGLAEAGMVTDALWDDVNRDGRPDLLVVGEWMPISLWLGRADGTLRRAEAEGLGESDGWWNRIVAGDFTGDGRTDYAVGNVGLNTRLSPTPAEPVRMYVKDFDRNGFVEQIITRYNDGVSYPIALRSDLVAALPYLDARLGSFEDYARASISDVFTDDELADAEVWEAKSFASVLAVSRPDGSFELRPLPRKAQFAPIYGLLPTDLDGDGALDLLTGGNLDAVKPEFGRMSAGRGLWLRGDGAGGFEAVPGRESGFVAPGEVRSIHAVRTGSGVVYLVARNNATPLLLRPRRDP